MRPVNGQKIIRAVLHSILLCCLVCSGCRGGKQPGVEQVVARVRSEVAAILKRDASQIDVTKPLAAQGADELDTVEIVMAVEEAFKVEIPDRGIGEKIDDVSKTLTVEKLAEIVSAQLKAK